jgi:hypothetical protein
VFFFVSKNKIRLPNQQARQALPGAASAINEAWRGAT